MVFDLDHWRSPRSTIACKFQKNDIAYATHGAQIAMEAIRMLNLKPSVAREMSVLDYGCGTARASRVLSYAFREVWAYDPVEECIAEGQRECPGLSFPNLHLTSHLNDVQSCDLAVSMNVIEHLDDAAASIMIANLRSKVPNGLTVLWYSASKNAGIVGPYLTEAQRAEDAQNPGIMVRVLKL